MGGAIPRVLASALLVVAAYLLYVGVTTITGPWAQNPLQPVAMTPTSL